MGNLTGSTVVVVICPLTGLRATANCPEKEARSYRAGTEPRNFARSTDKAMNEKREMLRHFLAALAYRVQKSLRDAPEGFAAFSAGNQVRTPHELLCHITSVLGYARTFFLGGIYPRPVPGELTKDIATFHEMLADLGRHLNDGSPLSRH